MEDRYEPVRSEVVQYLEEAHASERSLARVMQAQILMTPSGRYRTAVESHLTQTLERAPRSARVWSRLRRASVSGSARERALSATSQMPDSSGVGNAETA
jgi:predicted Zn-dependent protease